MDLEKVPEALLRGPVQSSFAMTRWAARDSAELRSGEGQREAGLRSERGRSHRVSRKSLEKWASCRDGWECLKRVGARWASVFSKRGFSFLGVVDLPDVVSVPLVFLETNFNMGRRGACDSPDSGNDDLPVSWQGIRGDPGACSVPNAGKLQRVRFSVRVEARNGWSSEEAVQCVGSRPLDTGAASGRKEACENVNVSKEKKTDHDVV